MLAENEALYFDGPHV